MNDTAIGRAIETVNTTAELQETEAENEVNDLENENDATESDIESTETNINSLKAQLTPNVAAAATELQVDAERDDDVVPVAAAADTLETETEDTDVPAAANAEPNVTQEGDRHIMTTSGGAKIDTNVGTGGDEVIITDPNGQQIKAHGDPHLDFNNDGTDDAHFGDNSQIHLSDGSIVHLNSVKEGDEWYTRGVFLEDVDGTVTQIGRSADDSEHVAEAQEVDRSAIQGLGSDDQGAAIFGINADGTAMIKNGENWHELQDESFDDFKENMGFEDQIGEQIDPGFAPTRGESSNESAEAVDVAGANAAGVDGQLSEGAVDIAAQNGSVPFGEGSVDVSAQNDSIQAQIDALEGEVQVMNADVSNNEGKISTAESNADIARSEQILHTSVEDDVVAEVNAAGVDADVNDVGNDIAAANALGLSTDDSIIGSELEDDLLVRNDTENGLANA